MCFTVDAPNRVRVRWDRESSSWGLGCEMVYTFSGGDAIDMSFSFTAEEEHASLDYMGFMWASYMHNAEQPGIFFPVKKGEERAWILYAPPHPAENKGANVVATPDVGNLLYDLHSDSFNIKDEDNITVDAPYYYGNFYKDIHRTNFTDIMHYVMMFQQEEGLRYAGFNWREEKEYSAWDWQYIVTNLVARKEYRYAMRCLISPSVSEEKLERWHQLWIASLDNVASRSSQEPSFVSFPKLSHYWHPASLSMGLSFLENQIDIIYPN